MLVKDKLFTLKEASEWASKFLNRNITENNISYLINYGRIKKYRNNGVVLVDIEELRKYYQENILQKEKMIKDRLGNDINWELSFDWLSEKERTKHVHRLHPYKGKFIPQLVEYFLTKHFAEGDIILDPFMGSGTTLIQANEMNIHSIGIDISEFNTIITEVKFANIDPVKLALYIKEIVDILEKLERDNHIHSFEEEIKEELQKFNQKNFPSPEFKEKWRKGEVTKEYIESKEQEFLQVYKNLTHKYNINLQFCGSTFLDKWYIPNIRREAELILDFIKSVKDDSIRKTLMIILSRSIRSVRATTHMDLDRVKSPQYYPYFCYKHFKICKPVFSIIPKFKEYTNDSLMRLLEYKKIKTDAYQVALTGDSRNINIFQEVKKKNEKFYQLLKKKKISGIFTSPPYLGQIDYHDQHAYAYELFGIERKDELEIGAAFKGENKESKEEYIKGISDVLKNSLKYMIDDPLIFIVANDKYGLYSEIAKRSGLKIEKEIKRPVLNRTARDKNAYYESVFIMMRE